MKRFSRITKKSVSILLVIAMLMSVCIVGLTTLVSAYKVNSADVTEARTFVYDFYSETYKAYHGYAWNSLYWTAGGSSVASVVGKEGGLHVTTSQLLWVTTGGTARLGYTTNVYVKDTDNGLANANGVLKFEKNTDYGVVVKYKINNLAELQAEIAKEGSTQSTQVCVALGTAKGLSNGAAFKKGNVDAIDIIDLTNYNSVAGFDKNGVILGDDGWRYMCLEVDGDNPSWHATYTNDSTQTLALTSWVYGGSTTGLTTIPVEIVYESVTVTAVGSEVDHITTDGATNTINTNLMLAKQVETDGSYAYKYIQKGAALPAGYYCGEFTTMADDEGYYKEITTTAPKGATYKWRDGTRPEGYWPGNSTYLSTFAFDNTYIDAEGLHFYSNKFFKNAAVNSTDFADYAIVFDRNHSTSTSTFASVNTQN